MVELSFLKQEGEPFARRQSQGGTSLPGRKEGVKRIVRDEFDRYSTVQKSQRNTRDTRWVRKEPFLCTVVGFSV